MIYKMLCTTVFVFLSSVLPSNANELSPISLTRLVLSHFDGDAIPSPAPGTTKDRILVSGMAGLVAEGDETSYRHVVVLGTSILCRFDGNSEVTTAFTADFAERIGSLIRPFVTEELCMGMLFLDSTGSPHVFLQTEYVAEGRSGVWVSDQGDIPILHLPDLAPNIVVARAVLETNPLPSSIIGLGRTRFATEAGNGDIIVFALSVDGTTSASVRVCAPESTHPLFQPSPFKRHGEAADAAYQAVVGGRSYDPLAYVACP